jgi:hypothetical protein
MSEVIYIILKAIDRILNELSKNKQLNSNKI